MTIATETIERVDRRQVRASMIRRVKIRNYKSIKNCDVELKPFTILVGRNGSGKSNFLNAIRLISEGLRGSSDWGYGALNPWSGIADGLSDLLPATIELTISLQGGDQAVYEVVLDIRPMAIFGVRYERLEILGGGGRKSFYECRDGKVVDSSVTQMPRGTDDRLYLLRASGIPEFRPAFDALSSMGFYEIEPEVMRRTQGEHNGLILARNGSNFASIWNYLECVGANGTARILQYLNAIVPEFGRVQFKDFGLYKTLVLERNEPGLGEPRSFYARALSDGTLRALGILVAINQLANDGQPIRLVGIEEPETALHPAAAGAMMDAFREATNHTQVLVTTHGADLLDRYDPDEGDHLLLVTMSGGATTIAPIDEASRIVLKKHLDTAGGLLRMDQLVPDPIDLGHQESSLGSTSDHGDV